MNRFIALFFILFTIQIEAQVKAVHVDYQMTYEGDAFFDGDLTANSFEGVFISHAENKKHEENVTQKNEDYYIRPKTEIFSEVKYYLKRDSPVVFWQREFEGEKVLIRDSMPNFNWKIIPGKTKEIGGYTCQKATTHFRGAHNTAWFASEIPIPFGPIKFKGLPGLILELYSSDGLRYKATKIRFIKEGPVVAEPDSADYKLLTYETFIKTKEEQIRKNRKTRESRMPKEMRPVRTRESRGGFERVYEWEK